MVDTNTIRSGSHQKAGVQRNYNGKCGNNGNNICKKKVSENIYLIYIYILIKRSFEVQ